MSNGNQTITKTLDRRAFIQKATALGLGAIALPLADSFVFPMEAQAADLALTMFVWSGGEQGTVAREVVGDFIKKNPGTSIELYEESNTVAYPKMKAAREADPKNPLVNFGYFNTAITFQGDNDKMWIPLNPANIPNMADIYPAYHRPGNMGIGNSISPIGIAYNTDMVKTPPGSWADVWSNPAYKGRVILFDYLWPFTGVIQAARMNGGSEANPDPGFEVWAKHTDQILALVTSTQQAQDLLARGDAWVTIYAKGNVQQWADAGAPIGFAVPKEGLIAFPLFFQMVVGTTPAQQAVAEKVLNILLTPASLARWCALNGLAPVSPKVTLPDRLAKDPAYSPDAIKNAIQLDWATLAANDAEYRQKWDRMVKSKL